MGAPDTFSEAGQGPAPSARTLPACEDPGAGFTRVPEPCLSQLLPQRPQSSGVSRGLGEGHKSQRLGRFCLRTFWPKSDQQARVMDLSNSAEAASLTCASVTCAPQPPHRGGLVTLRVKV